MPLAQFQIRIVQACYILAKEFYFCELASSEGRDFVRRLFSNAR